MSGPAAEINKDTFWELISQAKECCGQDTDAFAQYLEDRLTEMGAEQALRFDAVIHGYQDLAYKYGLWSAATIMLYGCSNGSFIDFRGWLIAQGKDVYFAALKDPDSLAALPVCKQCCFERINYVGGSVYEKLTGHSAYDRLEPAAHQALVEELRKDVDYGDGTGYLYIWREVAGYCPKLFNEYMAPKLAQRFGQRDDTWNTANPDVRSARASAKKSKRGKKNRGNIR